MYGEGTYGDDQTYGQEIGESAVTGVRYEMMPFPGWHPGRNAWSFRIGDTEEPFVAIVANYDNPTELLDVSTVTMALLVLREVNYNERAWIRGFPVLPNPENNTFERFWHPTDLARPGEFAATLRLLFDSGRYLTTEAQDDTTFVVAESVLGQATS